MGVKYGRNYQLSVQVATGEANVIIAPPFSLEFDVNLTYFSTQNNFNIRVYNLADITRNKLRKDDISYQFGVEDFREIILEAGYGDAMPIVLRGNMVKGQSFRQGNDFITELNGFDSGFAFANGITASTFPANFPRQNILLSMCKSLPQMTLGCISETVVTGSIRRGNSYDGHTCDLLTDFTGGAFFTANGVVHVLNDDEVTDDPTIIIDSTSGLLGTPVYEAGIIHLDLLFEPRIKLGQQVVVTSLTEKRFNGNYKVIAIHHRGLISPTVCGEAVTTLGLVQGEFNPVARAIQS